MSRTSWTRGMRGAAVVERNAQLAATQTQVSAHYSLDPFAHLDEGHVLILGLADDTDPEAEAYTDDDGATIRLKRVAFHPYEHERELVAEWIDMAHLQETGVLRFRNLHGEKSRQMGWTWTLAWVLLWALIYHPETAGLVIHLKLSKVDDGGSNSTPESIFGRIRFMAESRTLDGGSTWPDWQRPSDFLDIRGGGDPHIVNRYSGARLVGSGATEDPGRGGTYTHALVDEAARIMWGQAVQASMRSACPRGRAYISTPWGKDNLFYGLREPRRAGFRYVRHHWSQHPLYSIGLHVAGELDSCTLCQGNRAGIPWDSNEQVAHRYPGKLTSPWYDEAVIELTDEQVAQEYDISYEQSLEARVYPEFSTEIHVLPSIPYDKRLGIEFSWDFGVDTTAVGIWQEYADMLCKIGEYEGHDETPEDVCDGLRATLVKLGVPARFAYEGAVTRGWLCIGDPAGEMRQQATARSLMDDYRAQGFNIISERQTIARTILAVKRLLFGRPKPVRYSAATCPLTIRHLEQNRWPTDKRGMRKEGATEPRNDEHNHMMRADAYYACFKFPPPQLDEHDPTASASYLPDEEPFYKKVEGYDDVPAGPDDPYRAFM